jgi:GTP:adenosylcobinamide-phosphate guanylyltransferase/thiamine kinase-like enzyme
MPDYVIVQAGGRGSRLRHLTWNKPKCLVSVEGRPILYRIFDSFPDSKFIIIGDYKFNEMSSYLQMEPPPCEYSLIHTTETGTASGISDALQEIDDSSSVVIIWSDILVDSAELNDELDRRIGHADFGVLLTDNFVCRWSMDQDEVLSENPSTTNGVAGIFYMKNKAALAMLPAGGEFVKWISRSILKFDHFTFNALREVGDFDTIEWLNESSSYCRFFNNVTIQNDVVKKSLIDERYRNVADDEVNWYQEVSGRGFGHIPKIYSYDPLVMQRIHGKHLFQLQDMETSQSQKLIEDYLDVLGELHAIESAPADFNACYSVYFQKTVSRTREIEPINPFASRKSLVINGLRCKNYLHSDNIAELERIISDICAAKKFAITHGDCTFSNSLLSDDGQIYLIDPRGSFDKYKIFGDPRYDFAKLYYSCYSNYDGFNRRKFKLYIDADAGIAEVLMNESLFKSVSNSVFQTAFGQELSEIKVINAMIWASLSGYVKDDFDSAIGSYCLGIYYLNEALK